MTKHWAATHGMSGTKTYRIWWGMIQRCRNPNVALWPLYGGRGIKVCNRWKKFENFYADMGARPDGLELDRRDSNGNYEPNNCRWTTRYEQTRNTRRNRLLTYQGKTKTLTDWAVALGINPITMRYRVRAGWDVERAFTQPVRAHTIDGKCYIRGMK